MSCQDIAEILLKFALNTNQLINQSSSMYFYIFFQDNVPVDEFGLPQIPQTAK